MRKYLFTEAAPSKVGGQPNTGVGTEVEYADGFADAYVAMGWLIDKEAAAKASAEADAAEAAARAEAEVAAAEAAAKEAAEKEAAEKAAAEEKAKAEAEVAAAQKKAGKKAGETGGAGA